MIREEEVRAAIIQDRRKQGNKHEPMPELIFEEVHTCLLCNGENKEGQHLSFDAAKMLPPGEQNSDEEGNPTQ